MTETTKNNKSVMVGAGLISLMMICCFCTLPIPVSASTIKSNEGISALVELASAGSLVEVPATAR